MALRSRWASRANPFTRVAKSPTVFSAFSLQHSALPLYFLPLTRSCSFRQTDPLRPLIHEQTIQQSDQTEAPRGLPQAQKSRRSQKARRENREKVTPLPSLYFTHRGPLAAVF